MAKRKPRTGGLQICTLPWPKSDDKTRVVKQWLCHQCGRKVYSLYLPDRDASPADFKCPTCKAALFELLVDWARHVKEMEKTEKAERRAKK